MFFLAKEVITETKMAIHGYRQIEKGDRIEGRFPEVRQFTALDLLTKRKERP